MRLVFAGTPEVAVPSLEALAASRTRCSRCVTRPDAPRRPGPRPGAVTGAGARAGARARRCSPRRRQGPRVPASPAALSWLPTPARSSRTAASSRPDAAGILPAAGWVNLHFSLLPAWRGAAPVQHAVMAGDEVTGATTFRIEQGLDTGPAFGVMTETIRPTDTAGDLLHRLSTAGAGLLVATLDGLESGDLVAVPQPARGRLARAQDHRRGRARPLGAARARGRPADPGLHPRPGRLDDLPGRAGQARAR